MGPPVIFILQNDGGTTLVGDLEIDGEVKGAVKFEQNEIDVLPVDLHNPL